jgi:hypothetical protein
VSSLLMSVPIPAVWKYGLLLTSVSKACRYPSFAAAYTVPRRELLADWNAA